MREITPTSEQIEFARQDAKELGILKHSFRRGEGNCDGFLGERLVAEVIGAEICRSYDFDLVKNGLKIDVKTKTCTSKPQPHYNCSVYAYNTTQKCDIYVFVRILKDLSRAWIVGSIWKAKFFEKATLCRAGEADPKSANSYRHLYPLDVYNLPISILQPIKT